MEDYLTVEIYGSEVDEIDLDTLVDYEIVDLVRFEGHSELLQIIVPLAATGYLTISRILTFIEKLLGKHNQQEIQIKVISDSEVVGKQIKGKSDVDLVKEALIKKLNINKQ